MSGLNDSASVRVVLNGAALAAFLRGPNGPVYADMIRRGQRVQDAAKAQIRLGHVHGGSGRPNLRDTLVKRVVQTTDSFQILIGSESPIALIHHNGTRAHTIVPKKAKMLAFSTTSKVVVFAKIVHHPGTKPNRFLTDNLSKAL